MPKRLALLLATVLTGLFVLQCFTSNHAAAAGYTAAAFTVTPAQLSFTVTPSASSQTAIIKITNTYSARLHLVADLRSIDEDSLQLIPTGPLDDAVSSAIKLSSTDITVPANGTYELKVAVNASDQLTDGGHYATLVLTQHGNSGTTSTFQSSVAVSLFIIKNQNIRTNLQLSTMQVHRTLFSLPSSAVLTFKNLGNTHVIPRGSISIYDGQTLLGKAVVNTNSRIVFPHHQADFTAQFETYGRVWWPRKLHLQTMYRIDGSDIELMKNQTFWYIPFVDVVIAVVIIGAIWWQHRRLARYMRRVKAGIRTKLHTRRRRNLPVLSKTPQASSSTKRILGRTVIRAHRVASLLSARRELPKTPGSSPTSVVRQIPVHRTIPITIADDTPGTSVKADNSAAKQTKAISTIVHESSKSKAPTSKQPQKTAKKTPKSSPGPRTNKSVKTTAKKAPSRSSAKPKKSPAKTNTKKAA